MNSVGSFFYFFMFLFLTVGMSACRSHKKTAAVDTSDDLLISSCYSIESLWVPSCKLEITVGSQSFSLNGSVYIRPDSVCYFRGRMVMEVLRGAVYRDSFVIVNYMDRICYRGKNDYLQKITGYPVNPESLMMLFTADRCEETYRKFNFVTAISTDDYLLMQGENRNLLEIGVNAKNRTMEGFTLYNSQQRQPVFSAAYSSYAQYAAFALPTVFDILAYDDQNPVRIQANFQQILFHQSQPININIPSKFKVVVLE